MGDFRRHQLVEQIGRGGEQHAAPRGTGLEGQRDRQMGLADARPADEQHVGGRVEERQVGQLAHPRGGEARLEAEVERLQGAQHREAGAGDARVDRAVGLIGQLQLDQPRQIGGVGHLALGGAVGLGLEVAAMLCRPSLVSWPLSVPLSTAGSRREGGLAARVIGPPPAAAGSGRGRTAPARLGAPAPWAGAPR